MNSYLNTTLGKFRLIALLEGISFIILLFIAMPLKYLAGMPLAVKYIGWVHGALFVFYVILLVQVWIEYNWKFIKVLGAFIASLLPFGTFYLDKKLKEEQH
jgi:integral membrane protein